MQMGYKYFTTKDRVINMQDLNRDKNIWSVYMHTCTQTNKKYIGITSIKPENRWRQDGSGYKKQSLFWNAIQKYGWDNFEHKILLKNVTFEYACAMEKYLIKHYKTTNKKYGYNCTLGGEGMKGWVPTTEWRIKQNNAKKGKPIPEHVKQILKEVNTGRIVSEKTRKKISENHADFSGEKHPQYGTHRSEETKKKLSEVHKGKYKGEKSFWYGKQRSEKTKEKIRVARTGMRLSEETKEKISQWQQDHPQEKERPLRCIETGNVYRSINAAQRELGIYHIGDCCRGKAKSSGGLHFEFIDKEM